MSNQIWRLRLTATHLLENLATDLYRSPAHCLMEIVRNGACACMPDSKWSPALGNVEIHLVDNHPLGPKSKSLVVLDHGSGFTKPAIDLYCTIGRARGDLGDGHSGAAQKRIGRFAALALNERCVEQRDTTTGFYILTRTSAEGPVMMVSLIPDQIEQQDGVIVVSHISPNATEMGPQKGIKGSFTAIVVPNSVFKSYDEIRTALKWLVPRKQDRMYKLVIGGKVMVPLPLSNKIALADGPVEVYIDKLKDTDDPDAGIWFADAQTGIRVASARVIGHQKLPYPLWRADLTGDIFIPDLLANQDTSRAGLSSRYFNSSAWKRALAYLVSQVVPKVKALVGDDDVFGRDSASRSLLSFVEKCNAIWGNPGAANGGGVLYEDIQAQRARAAKKGVGDKLPSGSNRGAQLNPSGERQAKPRVLPVRIGDRTFVLNPRPSHECVFAEVDICNPQVIHINDSGYKAMPTTREARDEHVLLMILQAAGQAQYPDDIDALRRFVGERRKEFLESK